MFEAGIGADIRRDLMDKCNLHTILGLPTGIFYAQGVKTNVLFFTKLSDKASGSTRDVWVYDMRANMPKFGKRTPFTRAYFMNFEAAYFSSTCRHRPGSLSHSPQTQHMRHRRVRGAFAALENFLNDRQRDV